MIFNIVRDNLKIQGISRNSVSETLIKNLMIKYNMILKSVKIEISAVEVNLIIWYTQGKKCSIFLSSDPLF